jgi:hypothetical protein
MTNDSANQETLIQVEKESKIQLTKRCVNNWDLDIKLHVRLLSQHVISTEQCDNTISNASVETLLKAS